MEAKGNHKGFSMQLDEELVESIRELFERPEYYGRSLTDIEVQEIADNLVAYGELLIDCVKEGHKSEM